jgi:hypothetical protein
LVNFGVFCNVRCLYILWPFGLLKIFCGILVYLWSFGIFPPPPFWCVEPRKFWQPWLWIRQTVAYATLSDTTG